MAYVDGFVAAVPSSNLEGYRKYSEIFAPIMKEAGALQVVDCWGDDVPDGQVTSFPMAVKCREDETVVFSWIVWPSKAVRNSAWEKLQEDERFHPDNNPMPFDGKRMIFGGFDMIVDE
jgi:uncharacterized protein YbaA (DUF1428 family)